MNFLEALQEDTTTEAIGSLTTLLRADDVPDDTRKLAQTIANQMEAVQDGFDDFRSEAATLPNFFYDRNYTVEGATQLQTEANLRVIRKHDPEGAIGVLETNIGTFLGKLARKSAPVPPTDDPALLEALLLGARQDARDALSGVQVNLPEAILALQTEALENSEDALAYLLGSGLWAERFVKKHGTVEEQIDFERIKGTLRDNVSDPSATPYRQAAERFAELDDVPKGLTVTWKNTLESSGLLIETVANALGLD